MTHESDLCSFRELYSLGGLTGREQQDFEAHLQTCRECQVEVEKFGEVSDWLLYDFEDVAVPSGMRERVLSHVFAEDERSDADNVVHIAPQRVGGSSVRRRRSTAWIGVAAAVIVVGAVTLHFATSSPRAQSIQSFVPGATATVAMSSSAHQMFMDFSGLQPVHGSQVYQVWLIKDGAPPASAGVFVPNSSGRAVFAALVPSGGYHTVAVTLEPKAIDAQPLGTKVFAGTLG